MSHHKHCDVGEEDHSDSQQHHRPREPEAQVPEVKPSVKWEEAQQTWRQKNVCYMFSQQRHMNVNLAPMIPAADSCEQLYVYHDSTISAGVAPPTSQSHCSHSWLVPRSRGTAASSRKPPQAQQSWHPPTDDRGDKTMREICFCYSPS